MERQRYLTAELTVWSDERKRQILQYIAATGHKTDLIPIEYAFAQVKTCQIKKEEVLFSMNDFAGLVYMPCGPGLMGIAGGGYGRFEIPPWMPIGTTGVIRGDIRNATVVANEDMEVIIIPKEVYLKYWHTTYNAEEFKQIIEKRFLSKP